MSGANNGCLVVLVLDLHPQLAALGDANVHTLLNAACAFANSHLAFSVHNQLAVIAANHRQTRFLFPRPEDENQGNKQQKDGRLEMLGSVDGCIHKQILKMAEELDEFHLNDAGTKENSESLLAGAIGRGLCYIKRKEAEDPLKQKLQSRIVVVKTSSEGGGQYLNYINVYLSAQKLQTAIDVIIIGDDSGLLQQGADITGGYYYKVNQMAEILEVLLLICMAEIKSRPRLALPPQASVDYRAACFCHKSLIDMGYVCSNCLSVYCSKVPLCTTCNAQFGQLLGPTKKLQKRRR